MHGWLRKFTEKSLHEKEDFDSNLNKKNITAADYKHVKRFWKEFGIKNLDEHHNFFLQSNKLLLADVFDLINELDPGLFLSAPKLAWQASLKKTKLKLELLTDIDMLLVVEKEISDGKCQAICKSQQQVHERVW